MDNDKPKNDELREESRKAATILLKVMEKYGGLPGDESAKIVIEAGKVIADLHRDERRRQVG